ncbi:MAG: LapA family protein [bacterium]
MKWVKTIVLISAMLIAFLLATLAVNQQEMSLTFAVWETPFKLSMFWWLLAAFLVGLAFGLCNALWLNVKARLHARKLQKSLAQAESELERLRSLTVQS